MRVKVASDRCTLGKKGAVRQVDESDPAVAALLQSGHLEAAPLPAKADGADEEVSDDGDADL